MEKSISAWEARRQFGKLLRDVTEDGANVVVESHGEPVAAIVPIETYRRIKQRRAYLHAELRRLGERANLSEDEAMTIALEVVAEIRGAR